MAGFAAGPADAYSGGPPDGHAGEPPEFNTCTACHSSFPLNSGNGSLAVLNVPPSYIPGEVYPLTVYLVDPGQRLWGFELTSLRTSDGLQGGTLASVDATTQVSTGPFEELDYIKQTLEGTYPNATSASWSILWTAPPAGTGPVELYVAGNAANNNHSTTFDFVYALFQSVPENVPGSADPSPSAEEELRLSVGPNPVRDWTRIACAIPGAGPISLRLVDAMGREVQSFGIDASSSGKREWIWDRRDREGRSVPAGLYFCALAAEGETRIVKILVLP
jgi:hypothetical protein